MRPLLDDRQLAIELALDNITVNSVAPGPVDTATARAAHTELTRQSYLRLIPMKRFGRPEEIAAAVSFLCSDDASYITRSHDSGRWWLSCGRCSGYLTMLPIMLILGLILFGMLVGAGAQLILGKSAKGVDWTLALVAGLVGSFIGGLVISLLSGDGLQFRPSGIIGSLVGALLVTAGWQWYRRRSRASHA